MRVPKVMEKHGKTWGENLVMEKSWKMCNKNKVMEIKNILEKSWNFSTACRK